MRRAMRWTISVASVALLTGGLVLLSELGPFRNLDDRASYELAEDHNQTLPLETPDTTPMVDGTVRAIAQIGDKVWVGGNFSHVEERDGAVTDDAANVAVFDSSTGRYLDIAPELGDENSTVWDMDAYGDDVVIAGDFLGPSAEERNLIVVDGATGAVVRWYDSPVVRSALAVPELGRVYGGGLSLSAFDYASGERLWSRAEISVDEGLRSYGLGSGYRDLELGADDQTIWAACGCDAVEDNPAKAVVRLNTEGGHDASWVTEAEPEAFGISVADHGRSLYLAAGGSDFLAAYPKAKGGEQAWYRDTSGSAQVVEEMGGRLAVGGHFWEVAEHESADCGHRSSDNAAALDPNEECQTRKGLAAYSFDGVLEPGWDPQFSGKYNLVWALHSEHSPEGPKLHVGGEFLTVEGVKQNNYARLAPP